jgi:hypothetical protein
VGLKIVTRGVAEKTDRRDDCAGDQYSQKDRCNNGSAVEIYWRRSFRPEVVLT